VRQDLDRLLHRVAGVDPVVLDAHQGREPGALARAGSGEHPGVRRRHDVVGNGRVALVQGPDNRRLRIRVRRLPPGIVGDQGVVLAVHGVLRVAGLVADHQPVGAERGRLEPGPPEHRVRAEERQVYPGVPGRRHAGAFRRGPVLVVAERDKRARAVQRVRVAGDVHAGQVCERQPQALGQVDQLPLVDHEQVGALLVVGPVKADRIRARAVAAVRALVEVVAAPGVVGLPGRDAVLQHHLARRARGADGQRDVALRAGVRVEAEQVGPGRPAVGRHGQRGAPVGGDRAGLLDEAGRFLPQPAHRARLPDPASQVAVVPADAERHDLELPCGRGHVQVDRPARQHAALPRVPHDLVRGAELADPPVRVAGQ
jgi:hypothetical protein